MQPLQPDGIIKDICQNNNREEQPKKFSGNSKASGCLEANLEDAAIDGEENKCELINPKCINGLLTYEYRPEPYDSPKNRFAKYKPVFCGLCQKGRQLEAEWETEETYIRRTYLLKQSNLPFTGIFENLTLDSFAFTTNGATGWFQEVKSWVENWPVNSEKGLILYGKCGVGKTGLLVAALKKLLNQHFATIFYITVGDFIERIGEAWTERKGDDHSLVKIMCEAEILFMDEVGTGHAKVIELGSNSPLASLFKIIDFRYRYGKSIILATNCETPTELMEILGEKNFNRVFETCIQLLCVGRNLRG